MVGDDTTALDAVLECDTERLALLAEEHAITEELSGACFLVSFSLASDWVPKLACW